MCYFNFKLIVIYYWHISICKIFIMKNVGFLFAISAAIGWGLVYAIDQRILTKISPLTIMLINSALTVVIVLPFIFFEKNTVRDLLSLNKMNWLLFILAMILTVVSNFLILSGVKLLGASPAAILEIAYPFFVVLFSFLLFGQTVSWYFALGALLIFVGSVVIIVTS